MDDDKQAYIFQTILTKMEDLFPNIKNRLSYCAPELLAYRIKQLTGINIEELIRRHFESVQESRFKCIDDCEVCMDPMKLPCPFRCRCCQEYKMKEVVHILLAELRKSYYKQILDE